MKKTNKLTTAASMVALATALPAMAGPEPAPVVVPPASNGDWCNTLKTIGKVYSNKDASFIQEVKFFGRFHYQYAYVDGNDINGNNFNEDFDTVRRFRLGAQIKFLNGFSIMGRANVANDGRHSGRDRDWGFIDWDELKISYKKKNVAGFDSLSASYGRHKIGMGLEARMSSKKIKTVERTAMSNKIFSNRYTGLLLSAEKGNWTGTVGYLSLDQTIGLGDWSHGNAIYLLSEHEFDCGTVSFDLFYNLDADGSGDDEVGVGYEWAATASYVTDLGEWNLLTQLIYGDNGDTDYQRQGRDGKFWGVIIEPSTYIVEDKLEFVARYAYQGSSEDAGIRVNSRYTRANHGGNVNGGRGDEHHSLYAGLNWYLCDHNAKFMFGVEYETLDTPNAGTEEDADATTLWAAYRMYF
ncbi:MAG: OprO/OprP family phosphate-selective porin [Verrucomicrobiae bacterium]|nr:OprO/OprP family phosphate-selective porin [Verrucomicrobiae bacterium]NNJ85700.1 hypothetical protein [Akkermansiaceae bacterium]